MECPETGSFIGYKIVLKYPISREEFLYNFRNLAILKLEIPENAKRISSFHSKKCRCNKAKVLQAYDFISYKVLGDLNKCSIEDQSTFYSIYSRRFKYKIGKNVSVIRFDNNRWKECSAGIHFFMDIEDACRYATLMIIDP